MSKSGFGYPARTRRNSTVASALETFEHAAHEVRTQEQIGVGRGVPVNVWIAGRIIGMLDDGFVLQDESGRIDLRYGGEARAGDIVEVRMTAERKVGADGTRFMVFFAQELGVLAPCREDFFIKKSDPNHLRMVVDARMKEILTQRARMEKKIRDFFWSRGFIETGTPEMVRLPGMEPHLDVFKTEFRGLQHEGGRAAEARAGGRPVGREDMYLITSPEYAMKKLLMAGYEKIFQITKSFRNKETAGPLHNPEFTILEWYRAYADYRDIMRDTEELLSNLAEATCGSSVITFGEYKIDVMAPWPRKKVKELFREYAGIDEETLVDAGRLRIVAKEKGYGVDGKTSYEDAFFLVFLNEIEPKLGLKKPVIVYDYPVQMAALSKKCEDDPRFAERFEVYIGGVELCNAFTELNDPDEQLARLASERAERRKMGKEDYPVDQSFIRALKFGMPPSGGIALGVDRLAMILTGATDIKDVIFFPHKDL